MMEMTDRKNTIKHKMKNLFTILFPAIFTLMGCMFLLIAWKSGKDTLLILKTGIKTQGIVIENAPRALKIGERGTPTSRAPVVQFRTQSSDVITFYSSNYTTPALYEVGQTVDIWYMPDNPQNATLDGKETWILPSVFGLFGLVLSLIGLPWLVRTLFDLYFSKISDDGPEASKVSYSSDGRSGHVHFQSAEAAFSMYYEFSGGDCIVSINVPSTENWKTHTGLPLARRDEVLNVIGHQVVKDQTTGGRGYFKIEENWLNIYA
jgi:hypothetical protein